MENIHHRNNIHLQSRDFAILAGLYESRVMRSSHITSLYFAGRHEASKKRLQALKAASLISEISRRMTERSVLFVTRKGVKALLDSDYRDPLLENPNGMSNRRIQVSELTLRHELEVMDVKVALSGAIKRLTGYQLLEFKTRPSACQFQGYVTSDDGYGGQTVMVKPDGFIRIEETTEGEESIHHSCFLELDRSTESQQVLTTKVSLYREFYRSGGFAVRCGAEPSEFRHHPFRVLMIVPTTERLNRTVESLLHMRRPVLTQVWLATLDDLLNDPLGFIWIRPKNYRELAVQTQRTSHHFARVSSVTDSALKRRLFS
jgi:hypothetical protein